MSRLRPNDKYCDLTIAAGGASVRVHSDRVGLVSGFIAGAAESFDTPLARIELPEKYEPVLLDWVELVYNRECIQREDYAPLVELCDYMLVRPLDLSLKPCQHWYGSFITKIGCFRRDGVGANGLLLELFARQMINTEYNRHFMHALCALAAYDPSKFAALPEEYIRNVLTVDASPIKKAKLFAMYCQHGCRQELFTKLISSVNLRDIDIDDARAIIDANLIPEGIITIATATARRLTVD